MISAADAATIGKTIGDILAQNARIPGSSSPKESSDLQRLADLLRDNQGRQAALANSLNQLKNTGLNAGDVASVRNAIVRQTEALKKDADEIAKIRAEHQV
jgi:uncharacterized protein YlxW (UPF0749 family)